MPSSGNRTLRELTAPASKCTGGPKQFNHPVVGPLDLTFESIDLQSDDLRGFDLTIYTAQPGSASEDGLKVLASWAADSDGQLSVGERTLTSTEMPKA